MTRRSFCFLFGAGLAAAAAPVPPTWVADVLPYPALSVREGMVSAMAQYLDTQFIESFRPAVLFATMPDGRRVPFTVSVALRSGT